MNSERLHAIAISIIDDLTRTRALDLVSELRGALRAQVNSPGDPGPQQNVSQTLGQLQDSLEAAPSNDFPPTWLQAIEEIGGAGLLGTRLLDRIQEIFARNQITPSVAHGEIQEIHTSLEKLWGDLNALHSAMEGLQVGSEVLEPGECEIGILVPRSSIANASDGFSEELSLFLKTLGAFSEVATGSRPSFEIRSISSSDLTVFLQVAPPVAVCFAVAVERLVTFYKTLLEIRLLRSKLAEQGLPDGSLESVDAHANGVMEKGINETIEELTQRYANKDDGGRWNELTTELRVGLNRIATRIDKGYNYEVRAGRLREPDGDEPGEAKNDEGEATRESIATILNASRGLQFLRLEGNPILSLPETNDDDGENG